MRPRRVALAWPSTAARPPMAGDRGEVEGPRCSGQASPTTTYRRASVVLPGAPATRTTEHVAASRQWGHGHIPVIRVPEWIRQTPAVFRPRAVTAGSASRSRRAPSSSFGVAACEAERGAVVHGFELRGPGESPQRKGEFAGWQVQGSNLRRHTPTDLQTADSSALTGGFTVTRRTCALIAASLTPPVGASRPQPDLTEFVVSRCGKRLDGVRRRGPSRSASARRCGR